MPSTTAGSSGARGLRDRPLGRVAILAAVLLLALLASRSCASSPTDVSQQEAITIAREQLDFEPECVQIRYVRRGIPGQPFWAVSLWTLTPRGDFGRVAVVLVDAKDGSVGGITNKPDVRNTKPQCESPV